MTELQSNLRTVLSRVNSDNKQEGGKGLLHNCDWIRRFILFHKMKDRAELFIESENKIEAYLTHLAIEAMWLRQRRIRP